MENLTNSLRAVFLVLIFALVSPMFGQGEMPESESESNSINNIEIVDAITKHAEYPEDALYDAEEGVVYVVFKTDENQKISNISILKNRSDDEFEEAAHKAVAKFAKSENHQELLERNFSYVVPINFSLEN